MDLTPDEKRSLTLKGKYFPHKNGKYLPSLLVVCETCGKKFKKKQSIIKKTKHNYCSGKCDPNRFKKNQKPWNYGKGASLIIRICPGCKKQFKIRQPKNKEKIPKVIFCGARCAKIQSDNKLIYKYKTYYRFEPYYGPNWKKQKESCRIRDKNVCRICNKKNNIDIDHIIKFEDFDNYIDANNLNNLWCLCDKCHGIKTRLQEKNKNKLSYKNWVPLIKKWYPE